MGLYLAEVYRTPNIGIFLRANDKSLLIPKGVASTKSQKISENLDVKPCFISIEGTRLIGPLSVMNNKGILVSRMVEDYEMREDLFPDGTERGEAQLEVHGGRKSDRRQRQRCGGLTYPRAYCDLCR